MLNSHQGVHGCEQQYGLRSTVFHFLLHKEHSFIAIIAVTALPIHLLLALFTSAFLGT